MSVALVKGIIISLSVVAAVGIALQHPEVKEWIEEQRRRLTELLRTLSEGLDPQTRREAEAFAFEGRLPTQREVQGMSDAAAIATGREAGVESAARRAPRQGTATAEEMAERRRLGREYLARRNQELLDRRGQRTTEKPAMTPPKTPSTRANESPKDATVNGSFDALVNTDGTLKVENKQTSGGSVSIAIPIHQSTDNNIPAPVAVRAFHAGSSFSNPFGDEFAMDDDRSITPKPPVPAKIALTEMEPVLTSADPPISVPVESRQTALDSVDEELSGLTFEEQLARALSLSLAENEETERMVLKRTQTEQEAYLRAVQESLQSGTTSDHDSKDVGPLVDYSSLPSPPKHEPWSHTRNGSGNDDLYSLTPMTTGVAFSSRDNRRFDPEQIFHTIVASPGSSQQEPVAGTPSTLALSPASVPQEPISAAISPVLGSLKAASTASFDTDSDSDEFESMRNSMAASDMSLVEVEDIDIETMSDDEDGIHTPTSWSDVGSEVDDSERSESEAGDLVHL